MLAPPSDLVTSGQSEPSSPTSLLHNAAEGHTTAVDSHKKPARNGEISHNALTRHLVSTSPSEGIQGASRPTHQLIEPLTLAVPSSDLSTVNLVTQADRHCIHTLPKTHRGQFPACPLRSALTHTWAPHRHRGCSTSPLTSPLQRHLAARPLIGGEGCSSHQTTIAFRV